MYKISLLRDDVLLINDVGETFRVDELKKELVNNKENVINYNWHVAETSTWEPDAHRMVLDYLENQTVNEEVTGWFSQARDLFNGEHFAQINEIINKAFLAKPDLLTFYQRADKVDIEK